ncbi:MAG: TauD/TfdA family dioxygenase, partial [Pseudomonadota bacterium]|nr:TauD/TfdA family dioxygenase [Pseudomonadota bacterium]
MIEGPEAWHGNELAEDSRWRVYLDDSDIAELESALQIVKERGLAWRDMKKASDFPLNRFS